MPSDRAQLQVNAMVLTDWGTAHVVHVGPYGIDLISASRDTEYVPWPDLGTTQVIRGGQIAIVHGDLQPAWEQLSEEGRQETLDKLEVVQVILTGYRDGHAAFAREGEPRWDAVDLSKPASRGDSVNSRSARMARELEHEWETDRRRQREIAHGARPGTRHSAVSVRRWVRDYLRGGVLALVDARRSTPGVPYPSLDSRVVAALDEQLKLFNGNRSTVNNEEILRCAKVALKAAGLEDVPMPQRAARGYIAWRRNRQGHSTRAQATTAAAKVSGHKHYPALRPGQVVAIDVTRADNLVFDETYLRSMSVEIMTAIDVCSRCVIALRVVPMSADAVDVALLTYDMLRPFHLLVEGTTVSDWRWAGLPSALVSDHVARVGPAGKGTSVQGRHPVPGMSPGAISSDNAIIFLSKLMLLNCDRLGIDLLFNRKGKPTDNPHIERWHETLQRGVQQIGGYKGRSTSERGRIVAQEPLVTALELQTHLRRFVALDYHRSAHAGLHLPGAADVRLSPLDMYDLMLDSVGILDVPTNPDLLYDFLPVHWGVIHNDGIEIKDLVYDAAVLNEFRDQAPGRFKLDTHQAPVFYDPHDVSRVWFRHPDTHSVHEIPWRGRDFLQAPMTEAVAAEARKCVRARGGNLALAGDTGRNEILAQINELAPSGKLRKDLARPASAALLRVEQSRRDHEEAAQACQEASDQQESPGAGGATDQERLPWRDAVAVSMWDEAWPDLREQGA